MWQAGELLDRLDDLQEDVARADFADDVTGARRAIDAHADISKRLAKVPVDELEGQGKNKFFNNIIFSCSDDLLLLHSSRKANIFIKNWKLVRLCGCHHLKD